MDLQIICKRILAFDWVHEPLPHGWQGFTMGIQVIARRCLVAQGCAKGYRAGAWQVVRRRFAHDSLRSSLQQRVHERQRVAQGLPMGCQALTLDSRANWIMRNCYAIPDSCCFPYGLAKCQRVPTRSDLGWNGSEWLSRNLRYPVWLVRANSGPLRALDPWVATNDEHPQLAARRLGSLQTNGPIGGSGCCVLRAAGDTASHASPRQSAVCSLQSETPATSASN
jgi:hypothetical protein